MDAIKLANQHSCVDVLILARGGGSLEDLWGFNTEEVARAIAASQIPVISGVGHETDFTIADFVADVRAPTPSAAAMIAVPDQHELLANLQQLSIKMLRNIQFIHQQKQHALQVLRLRLQHPGQRLREQSQRIDELEQRLKFAINIFLNNLNHQLIQTTRALDSISPLATLKRGYAIVMQENGQVLESTQEASVNDPITILLQQGKLIAKIKEIF